MEALVYTLVLVFSVFATSYCKDEIVAFYETIESYNKLAQRKTDIAQNDSDLLRSIDIAKATLQLKLENMFKRKVREAMAEFRGSESIPNVRSRHVDSEIQRLKQGHHHMKRHMHSVMKTLRDVQLENTMYRDAFIKTERSPTQSCSLCGKDTKLLKRVLKQCKRRIVHSNSGNVNLVNKSTNMTFVLEHLSSTCRNEIEQSSSTPMPSGTSTPSTTSPVTTSVPVTTQQPSVMNRLIIGQHGSSELSQVNLQSNRLRKYPPRVSGSVLSLCFVQRLRRLLVGRFYSSKITSTTLDGEDTQTLRENVMARGMAVDEGRQLVFITTWIPLYSISSMTTRGEDFTVIRNLSCEYRYPQAIAVNTREREIYASSGDRVFKLNYNGKVIMNLASGDMWGVSFDNVRNNLYFNDGTTLKKMSMSDEVISDVTAISVKAFTLTYYNDTVYYGGDYGTHYVGAVQLGEKIVNTRLQTLSLEYNGYLVICLIP